MKNKIQYYLGKFNEKCYKTNLFVVANLQKQTKKMSYYTIEHASDNEFFSLQEFEEVASALLKTGLCLNVFYTEIDFIEYILNHYEKLEKSSLLVYNLARDGKKEGKKSLIPAFCDYFGIDYTGSNALTVSLCRNKFIWGTISNYFNIPTPKTVCIKNGKLLGNPFEADRYIRKEISESASINISNNSILEKLDWNSLDKRDFFLLQEFIPGVEVEVSFFNIEGEFLVLDAVKIICLSEILTSDISNNNDYLFEVLEDKKLNDKLKIATVELAQYLNIDTYGRVDFRIKSDGTFFVFDIATMPYTTSHSSLNYIFNEYGFTIVDLHKLVVLSSL